MIGPVLFYKPKEMHSTNVLDAMKKKIILALIMTVIFGCGSVGVAWLVIAHHKKIRASGYLTMTAPGRLDVAISMYALEHNKSEDARVTKEDLFRYAPGELHNGYLWPYSTPFGDEIQLSTVGAKLKIPYPSWKKLRGTFATNYFRHPIETEAEYKERREKTAKQ